MKSKYGFCKGCIGVKGKDKCTIIQDLQKIMVEYDVDISVTRCFYHDRGEQ